MLLVSPSATSIAVVTTKSTGMPLVGSDARNGVALALPVKPLLPPALGPDAEPQKLLVASTCTPPPWAASPVLLPTMRLLLTRVVLLALLATTPVLSLENPEC